MSRPLVPFTVSYIYGIAAAELFRYLPVTVSFVSLFLVAAAALGGFRREGAAIRAIIVIAAAAGLDCLFMTLRRY